MASIKRSAPSDADRDDPSGAKRAALVMSWASDLLAPEEAAVFWGRDCAAE